VTWQFNFGNVKIIIETMLVSNWPSYWLGATKSSTRSALWLLHVCLLAGPTAFYMLNWKLFPSPSPSSGKYQDGKYYSENISVAMPSGGGCLYGCHGYLHLPSTDDYSPALPTLGHALPSSSTVDELEEMLFVTRKQTEKNHFYRYLALIIGCQDSLFPSFFLANIVKCKFH